MESSKKLKILLNSIHKKGYKAYKILSRRSFAFENYGVVIDRVQGDPFATPSQIRVIISNILDVAFYSEPHRRVAVEDTLARNVWRICQKVSKSRGSGNSGRIGFPRPGQEVLERTCVRLKGDVVELRLFFGLPARGRTIDAEAAWEMFSQDLKKIVENGVLILMYDPRLVEKAVRLKDDQRHIRTMLHNMGLISFIADGSILPRRSGVDPRPMDRSRAVPFESPESLRVEIELPGGKRITGMGVRKGITVITGGGYHGKTTLLEAIQAGIYDHVEGDGREYVITDSSAFKIRSEDGRKITRVDISSFITYLPAGLDTRRFDTEDASGSTSMAANIVEAVESGVEVFLIDEDTSATNFMIRDARMQQLIPRRCEPIVPLIDRVEEMRDRGFSFIIVIGGSGDYLDVADTVIMMDSFKPRDVTEQAKKIAREYVTKRRKDVPSPFRLPDPRVPDPASIDPSRGRREEYLKSAEGRFLTLGRNKIDLSAVETFISDWQILGVGNAITYCLRHGIIDGVKSMKEILDELQKLMISNTIDIFFDGSIPPNIESFRIYEVSATINRLRTLRILERWISSN